MTNKQEEWISVSEFCRRNRFSSRDYAYTLIRGKKDHLIYKKGKPVRVDIKAKMIEDVHYRKDEEGKYKIHHTVKVVKGVVYGGLQTAKKPRKNRKR